MTDEEKATQDYDRRRAALEYALRFAAIRDANPDDVIAIAGIFDGFLRGDSWNDPMNEITSGLLAQIDGLRTQLASREPQS